MIKKKKKWLHKIIIIASMPSICLAIVILAVSILSICISRGFYEKGMEFESSLFSNIFAGLVTGFIIIVLSGTKSVYMAYLESKLIWLQQTHEMIIEHFSKRNDLFKANRKTDEEFFEIAYDAAMDANSVNVRIIQSTFDKVKWFDPPKYCKKHYKYDCLDKVEFFDDLHEFLRNFGEEHDRRKEVISRIEEASHIMSILDSDILNDITGLKIKIASAKKLFL